MAPRKYQSTETYSARIARFQEFGCFDFKVRLSMDSDSDDSGVGLRMTGDDDEAFATTGDKWDGTNLFPPPIKQKKAPDAPKRFKSAFIFFSSEKHKEIRSQMMADGNLQKTVQIAKLVAEAWKKLSPEEREKWEAMASRDKARYEMEKTMYKGPWKVPAIKRSLKDPSAPKRPMSAFLAYSNSRRAMVKKQNPQLGNAELSKQLSTMWKEAPDDVRKKYKDQEFTKRQAYKSAMAEWKKKASEGKRIERQVREDVALQRVDAAEQSGSQDHGGLLARNFNDDLASVAHGVASSHAFQEGPASGMATAAFGSFASSIHPYANLHFRSTSHYASSESQTAREKTRLYSEMTESFSQPLASLFTSGSTPHLLSNALAPPSSWAVSPYDSGRIRSRAYGHGYTELHNFGPSAIDDVARLQYPSLGGYGSFLDHSASSRGSISSRFSGTNVPQMLTNPFAVASATLHPLGGPGQFAYAQAGFGGRTQGYVHEPSRPFETTQFGHLGTFNAGRNDDIDAAAYDLALRMQGRASQPRRNPFGDQGSPGSHGNT